MADGITILSGQAANGYDHAIEAEPPRYSPAVFGLPAFVTSRSLDDVKELARLITLAEWAPDCYRDIDGNYLQPKIELAIMHGATVGLGPIVTIHAIALIGGKATGTDLNIPA